MPTTIDAENLKDIRKAMNVTVTLDAFESSIALSFSSSGSGAKIGQYGSLQTEYPMRNLADLQGDGFPLNGSCVLYESGQAASAANGKIGVRSKIGQNVAVRFTSTTELQAVTVLTRGVDYLIYNNEQIDATSGDTLVELGGVTSATITAVPLSNTTRAEFATISPGFILTFTQDEIVSVTASLRSDLKPIDPSLPESEIEIVAYYPYDISELMSSVRDSKPITYSAGYDGDMSTTRRFYLSEPASWKHQTLTIKGVDKVHDLDGETFPFFIGGINYGRYTESGAALRRLYSAMADQIWMAGIELINYEEPPSATIETDDSAGKKNTIVKRQSQRDMLANFMNLLHLTGFYPDFTFDAFWPTYVDAGIPTLYWSQPSVKWDIYEEDCGDVLFKADRKYSKITFNNPKVRTLGFNLVSSDASATAFKNSGIGLNYPDYSTFVNWYKETVTLYNTEYDDFLELPIDPQYGIAHPYLNNFVYGSALYDNQIADNKKLNLQVNPFRQWANWNSYMDSAWQMLINAGHVKANETTLTLESMCRGFKVEDSTYTVTNPVLGVEANPSKTSWCGSISVYKRWVQSGVTHTFEKELMPSEGFNQVAARSNETGSFTWKGDPRMQPRDFFNFHRLDGTVEVCTIEQITLTHSGGGTSAEITYRKGKI